MTDAAVTLGDLVTSSPALAGELERRGLDYCCGGDRTLADASTDGGLDLGSTIDGLRAAAVSTADEAPPWVTMDVAELVDHREATHHRYLWDELPRLSELIDRIVAVHGDRHRELRAVAGRLAELRANLEPHLLEEEQVLFPAIRQMATSAVASPSRSGVVSGRSDGFRPPVDAQLAETLA